MRNIGDSGLDGTDLLPKASTAPITDKNPILAMRDALMAHPKGTPWVVATGTLTNVALLFATFPEVAEHIAGLTIMGGGVGEGFTDAPMSRLEGQENRIGNVTPLAEFNIYVCPLYYYLPKPPSLKRPTSCIYQLLTPHKTSVTPKPPKPSSATQLLHPRPP